MYSGTLALLIGCLALQGSAELPATGWLWLLPVCVGLAFTRWLRLPALAGLGFLWALAHATLALHDRPGAELDRGEVTLEGVVASIPERRELGLRFLFDVRDARSRLDGQRLRINWYDPAPALRAGEVWRLKLRLKPARGLMNPGGFDYEAWLYQHGIAATGSVRTARDNRRLGTAGGAYRVTELRQTLAEAMQARLSDSPLAGVLIALVLGEQGGIAPVQWEAFARTGTTHLVAISGQHITLIAGLVFFLARRAWSWLPRAALWLPSPKFAAGLALLCALGYAVLAGFGIPLRRALVMIVVTSVALMLQRGAQPARTLAWALVAVLIYDPTSPLAAGFWLSFGAVALILYGMAQRAGREPWWRQWNRLQWLIALGLLPVTLLLFQRASLIAPLVNLIAVPWIGLVVTPLALAGTLLWPEGLVGGALLDLAAWLIELLWPVLDRLAQWPLAQWQTGAPSLVTLLAASAGALLLLAPRGLPVRGAGLALFLPLLLPNSDAPAPGAFEFTLLDVGQGLATVVRTRSHVLVYDTGPRFSESFDAGKGILTPFLHGEGVRFIDRVIVSHGDLDHRGGAANLLGAWRVGSVWSSDPAALGRDDVTRCTNDLAWEWDGVRFEILHPAPDAHWKGNDGSCVLRIVGRGGSVLLAGDIERGAERHLLRTQAAKLRADLLVVPHHGSKTSSSPGFIAAVAPRYALIAAGDHNRYGHPHASVLARYRAFGVNVLDSVHGGAIGFRFAAGQAPVPHSHRQAARRYWHAR